MYYLRSEYLSRFNSGNNVLGPHFYSCSQPLLKEFNKRSFVGEQGQDSWAKALKQGEYVPMPHAVIHTLIKASGCKTCNWTGEVDRIKKGI